ncbi:GTPase Era [Oxobacter pfennigii]|uniref:GTPase Era n=1 Tax=Oxobacter pfennigii TaxID=36849 RepID=A0A0P8W5Y4_9CLOT|nr:GTPase Era [Oxobacter pfennigii]KPU44107.1 GTPase Era [Oxobacter pfennigii]
MGNTFKSGFVTIIGRPNVGKSTIMNNIIGEKLSIISNKPQTTRNTIQSVLTRDDCQMVFIDTPGIHKPKHKLGEYMVKIAEDTLNEVDTILFMTTPDKEVGPGDKFIMEQFKKTKTPVLLVINKIDQADKDKLIMTIDNYSREFKFHEIIPVSALTGENIATLIDVIKKILPEGPKYFPDDTVTDQAERFIVAEIIREKALNNLEQEVPHGIATEIIGMKEQENNIMNINAVIYCEKDSHKGIIIGKNGQMLKKIGAEARLDIERLLGIKVFLEIWVKVKKDWRNDSFTLKGFGYK